MKNIDNIEEIRKTLPLNSYIDDCKLALSLAFRRGLFLEFGVATGGSINDIALLRPDTLFHGFDSFQGLPEPWYIFEKGHFKCDIPRVRKNVVLHIGMFEDTLPAFVQKYRKNISYCNFDCDLYSSTKTIFKHLGKRIIPGTILRFDELTGHPTWREDEYKALKEFLDENNYDVEFLSKEDFERSLVRIIKS